MINKPKITVLCPTYNEINFIEQVLKFCVNSLPENKEVFIIDGCSNDGTIELVGEWTKKYPFIKLLNNPYKYVPQALNIGIKESSADIIVRLDAHTLYDENYFQKVLETFENIDADIVGGPMNPIGENKIQKAVAYATTNIFGIGNSKFHDVNYCGYVDSVYLGAWKKKIFEDVGVFDEQMKRNQDDEFHYRAKSKGKKIYLNSEIKSKYFPRATFGKLFKQYFQYGLFKPLVLKKISSEIKLRHLIPAFFVTYLLLLPISILFPVFLLPFVFYLLIDVYSSFNNRYSLNIKLLLMLTYPILHISYGFGFLIGLFKLR